MDWKNIVLIILILFFCYIFFRNTYHEGLTNKQRQRQRQQIQQQQRNMKQQLASAKTGITSNTRKQRQINLKRQLDSVKTEINAIEQKSNSLSDMILDELFGKNRPNPALIRGLRRKPVNRQKWRANTYKKGQRNASSQPKARRRR